MKVSVITPTYKRPFYLDKMISSLRNQTKKPDEIVIVIKEMDERTKEIIEKYKDLNIVKVNQNEGYIIQAYDLGIKKASGDILLFIDDDAYAEEAWVEKYLNVFDNYEKIGGASGKVVTVKTNSEGKVSEEKIIFLRPNREAFWRKPLKELESYCGGISVSGLNFKKPCHDREDVVLSVLLHGSNMAFLREAIDDIRIGDLYKNSKAGLGFEMLLGYSAVLKGYKTLRLLNSDAPTVYHHYHEDSLTASKRWKDIFWKQYDRAKQYYRLKKLGADVSFLAYTFAMLVSFRDKPLPKILSTIYAQIF